MNWIVVASAVLGAVSAVSTAVGVLAPKGSPVEKAAKTVGSDVGEVMRWIGRLFG